MWYVIAASRPSRINNKFDISLNISIKANASTGILDHVNITVHNGAANVYAYGTDTVVNVSNAWLYSSGPVAQ